MSSDTSLAIFLEFDDNQLLSILVGPQDRNFYLIEQRLNVSLSLRGNHIAINGAEPGVSCAKTALVYLYKQLEKGLEVDSIVVEDAIRLASTTDLLNQEEKSHSSGQSDVSIATKLRNVLPRTAHQADYVKHMQTSDLIFCDGPAGTGKTYLAVAVGVSLLLAGKIDKIILSRPAVEAGEKLGFLPGDMREKVDPYLRPLYDALNDMLPAEHVLKYLGTGEIEVAPLAFMRGRTLSNAFIILDEAQNTTPVQMKMFLTRLGNNSRMVVTGDQSQIDLPNGVFSGLKDALETLEGVDGVKFVFFTDKDVVRHPLVSRIVHAYDVKQRSTFNQGQ